MRVAIDGSCWANRRGFGRFTRCLVAEMAAAGRHDYLLVIDEASVNDPSLPPLPGELEVVPVALDAAPAHAAGATSSRSIRDMLRMTRATRQTRAGAVFFPATYSYYPVMGAPVVVTIHDAIAERLPHLTLPTRADRLRWWVKQQLAVRQAKQIVTVSEASRRAIMEEMRVAPDRLHVIREAPAPIFAPLADDERVPLLTRFGLHRGPPYLLYVGGISPHKNVELLVAAFDLVAADHPQLRLVLVGDTSDDPFLSSVPAVKNAIAASPAADRIVMTGFVSDEELVALYGGAAATALPSFAEGFGLTAAESAACGAPVVASDDPALRELLGDAGVYGAADDPRAFADAFRRLLDDPGHRAERSRAASAVAAGWSWEAAADRTADLLERAAGG
ncbi:MAG: glycosyltransferase family 4 protein [Actinomycetota bacterium]